ncbi:hypothetical protein COPEUT_01805 [Coprococcus eutactus ATCC 27759]|nr:hypothetical protein COPEUT_01805 [Coprococcus eutactus ATCC 27759]
MDNKIKNPVILCAKNKITGFLFRLFCLSVYTGYDIAPVFEHVRVTF